MRVAPSFFPRLDVGKINIHIYVPVVRSKENALTYPRYILYQTLGDEKIVQTTLFIFFFIRIRKKFPDAFLDSVNVFESLIQYFFVDLIPRPPSGVLYAVGVPLKI